MLPQRLRYLRKKKHKTIEGISRDLGFGKSTYSGYENEGKRPPIEKLAKIANYHHVSIDYLLGITENPQPINDPSNMSEYLQGRTLHWDGIPLDEDDLRPIRDILSKIAYCRLKDNDDADDVIDVDEEKDPYSEDLFDFIEK